MKIFVTGGSSPLGDHVVPRLVESHSVVALARSDEAASRIRRSGGEVRRGSLEEPSTWLDDVTGADAIVHLAGISLAAPVLTSARVDQPVTVVSSASVHNRAHPLSAALRTLEADVLATRPGDLVLLRPTMIYGSARDRNVRRLARFVERAPAVPRFVGGGLVQPVFVDDVAELIANTIARPGRLVAEVGGASVVRLGVIVERLARLTATPVLPLPVPVTLAALVADAVVRRRPSRGLHALAMLRHDRVVPPLPADVMPRPLMPLDRGLELALGRYAAVEDA